MYPEHESSDALHIIRHAVWRALQIVSVSAVSRLSLEAMARQRLLVLNIKRIFRRRWVTKNITFKVDCRDDSYF